MPKQGISIVKERVKNMGISPIDKILLYEHDAIYEADHYLVLSEDYVYDVRIPHTENTDIDGSEVLANFTNETPAQWDLTFRMTSKQKWHNLKWGAPHDQKRKFGTVLYDFWKNRRWEEKLEDDIEEIQSDIDWYESRIETEEVITKNDTKEVYNLYKRTKSMRADAIQRKSKLASKVEDLLDSTRSLRNIIIQGDYVAGDKTSTEGSSIATDQSITAHDSVITSPHRKHLEFLEEMRDDLPKETYSKLKRKYTKK